MALSSAFEMVAADTGVNKWSVEPEKSLKQCLRAEVRLRGESETRRWAAVVRAVQTRIAT
jgi:hypothetical protein